MTDKNVFDDAKDASELADLIDRLMEEGSGHINIKAGNSGELSVNTLKSTDCSGTKGACCQPTELDDEEK